MSAKRGRPNHAAAARPSVPGQSSRSADGVAAAADAGVELRGPEPTDDAATVPETGRARWLGGERSRLAALMALLALIAVGALGYLTWVKLTNTNAVCFVVQGCDQVQASEYSRFLGIPVALYGLAMALTVLGSVIAWWRTGDRRLLYVPYTLGLIGVFVIAGLVYLELFVIHAVCIWCTTAGASLILGWIVSIVAMRRSARED